MQAFSGRLPARDCATFIISSTCLNVCLDACLDLFARLPPYLASLSKPPSPKLSLNATQKIEQRGTYFAGAAILLLIAPSLCERACMRAFVHIHAHFYYLAAASLDAPDSAFFKPCQPNAPAPFCHPLLTMKTPMPRSSLFFFSTRSLRV